MAAFTAAASLLGDFVLIPVTEVGSLAVAIGWLSACAAWLRRTRAGAPGRGRAWAGAAVSGAIVLMKVVPAVPGSFSRTEWVAVLAWALLGWLLWSAASKPARDGR
jgi:hypothetical protein